MIIKYFSSGSSSCGAVEYVEKNETAKTLKGNNNLTRDLIKNNTNKLKYRSGVLAFGSDRPTKKQVMEIIELFEESTFAGLDKDQYNSLWVEHNDKDNYHIHFVIPRLELSTMKAFNPHYHKADQKRLMLMQDYINREYFLINPYDLERRQTNLQKDIRPNMKDKELKEMLYKYIDKAYIDGLIENRDDVIKTLEEAGFTIKKSKNFISIVRENEKNIRLKGVFYNEYFTSRTGLREELEEEKREHRENTYEKLIENRAELDKLIQFKARRVNEHYTKIKKKQSANRKISNNFSDDRNTSSSRLYKDIQQNDILEEKRASMDTTNDDISRERQHIHKEQNDLHDGQRRPNGNINQNQGLEEVKDENGVIIDYIIHDKKLIERIKGLTNDSTRTTATRSTERSRTEQQELVEQLEKARERIQEQYINDSRELQRDNERATERTYKAIEQYHSREQKEQSEHMERDRNTKSVITRAFRELTERFKTFGTKVIDKLKETLRSSREEEKEATPQRQRPSRGFGMSR